MDKGYYKMLTTTEVKDFIVAIKMDKGYYVNILKLYEVKSI